MFTKLNSNIHNKLHGFQIFVLSPHINRFDTLVKCLIQALFPLFSFSLSLSFFFWTGQIGGFPGSSAVKHPSAMQEMQETGV